MAESALASPSPRARRALGALAFGALALTALVALGHAAPLRPLLGRFFGAGAPGCPVKGANPEELERARVRSSAALAGTSPAKRRVAGPFVVGETRRSEVDAWAARAGVSCTAALSGTALRCADVPAAALATPGDAPRGEDVFVRFAPSGVLVGLDVMRASTTPPRALALVDALAASVTREVGAPATVPPLDVATLEAPGIVLRTVEFRFRDFAVDVGVSRLTPTGPIVVREQYRAVD